MKSLNKSALAESYSVSLPTMNKWLATIPGLSLPRGCRVLTPKQLEIVYEHLGDPHK